MYHKLQGKSASEEEEVDVNNIQTQRILGHVNSARTSKRPSVNLQYYKATKPFMFRMIINPADLSVNYRKIREL